MTTQPAPVEITYYENITNMPQSAMDDYIQCRIALCWYVHEHGTARGFRWDGVDPVNWWDGLVPRFDCYAKDGCKVWKVRKLSDVQVGLADTVEPTLTLPVNYHMDVWAVLKPSGRPPTWFVVYPQNYQEAGSMLVCLASQTVGKLS